MSYLDQKPKILIVEDELLFRNLVVKICKEEFGFHVIGEISDGMQAMKLCRAQTPDLVLLDLLLPEFDGVELAELLFKESPQTRILVLSSRHDPYTVTRVMESKIHGFIDKSSESITTLKKAIQSVAAGQRFFSKVVTETRQFLMEDPLAFPKILSKREQQMLTLFAKGLSNQAISQQIGISPKTAQGHRHNIMKKLEIHDTPALMRYAIEKGFWHPNGG